MYVAPRAGAAVDGVVVDGVVVDRAARDRRRSRRRSTTAPGATAVRLLVGIDGGGLIDGLINVTTANASE